MLIFSLLVFVLIGILMCWVSVNKYHRLWNPIFVFFSMITLGVLFSYFDLTDIFATEERKINGIWLLLAGSLFFSFSFLFGQRIPILSHRGEQRVIYRTKTLSKLTTISLVLGIISTLLSIHLVIQIAGDISRVFLDAQAVRNDYLNRESAGGMMTFINLFVSINHLALFCLYPLAIKHKCRYAGLKLVIELLVVLIGSIITMSKESFIFYCLIFISSYLMNSEGVKAELRFFRKYAVYLFLLLVILIVVVSFQRNYTESRYENYTEAVVGTISTYIAVPITAFDNLIALPSKMLMGEQCFRPIVNILSRFGVTERISIFQDDVSDNVNVYTMFGNMYNDYGYFGIVFLSIFFGIIMGFLYTKKDVNRFSHVVANSIILPTMFFGFYDFKFIQTVYPFTILYSFFLGALLRRKLYLPKIYANKYF